MVDKSPNFCASLDIFARIEMMSCISSGVPLLPVKGPSSISRSRDPAGPVAFTFLDASQIFEFKVDDRDDKNNKLTKTFRRSFGF